MVVKRSERGLLATCILVLRRSPPSPTHSKSVLLVLLVPFFLHVGNDIKGCMIQCSDS